jgi:uncharacterized membrane protein/glutaredoxin
MIKVVLYTREGCQLCERAAQDLKNLQEEIPHELVEIDIESDAELLQHYVEQIPVVRVGPYTLNAPFTETELRITLAAARDGYEKRVEQEPANRAWTDRINRAVLFFSRHWLAILNLMVFAYVALPFAAPALMKSGNERPAQIIYAFYGKLCHQLAYRSWYLYGEQPVYPRELAGTDWESYEEVIGLNVNDHLAASAFVGNDELGYKVALCQRDVAIYGAILLSGLLFALIRKRLKPLPIWAWMLVGIIPIAIDGGSQLIFGFPLPIFSLLPMRESTPLLRTLTGTLFGIANVWLSYPYVEESMVETRVVLAARLAQADSGETA